MRWFSLFQIRLVLICLLGPCYSNNSLIERLKRKHCFEFPNYNHNNSYLWNLQQVPFYKYIAIVEFILLFSMITTPRKKYCYCKLVRTIHIQFSAITAVYLKWQVMPPFFAWRQLTTYILEYMLHSLS